MKDHCAEIVFWVCFVIAVDNLEQNLSTNRPALILLPFNVQTWCGTTKISVAILSSLRLLPMEMQSQFFTDQLGNGGATTSSSAAHNAPQKTPRTPRGKKGRGKTRTTRSSIGLTTCLLITASSHLCVLVLFDRVIAMHNRLFKYRIASVRTTVNQIKRSAKRSRRNEL